MRARRFKAFEAEASLDALVTDVHTGSSLAGLRDLGRAGLAVAAVDPEQAAAGMWSRYAAMTATVPDSDADPHGFVLGIGAIAQEHGPLVVYPAGESAIHAVLEHADALPGSAVLPYASLESLRVLRDKRELPRLAQRVGLTTPRTLMEATAAEVAAAPPQVPCVVKQVVPEGSLGKKTRIIETERALKDLLAVVPSEEVLLIQERAAGPLTGLALVIDADGRLVARFQSVARRLWPIEAGSSALAVSVAPNEQLVARGARLLADAGFSGLAQLQFLRTARGPALIDVNPRFYGSLPLASASGLNLPATWHAVVTQDASPTVTPYQVGVHYRWLEGDLAGAFAGSRRRFATRTPSPKTGAVWAEDDPVPGMIAGATAIGARVRRRVQTPFAGLARFSAKGRPR